jgi:hypothetical protein
MSQPSEIELPPQNVAIIGAFNPAILEPAWVKRWVREVREEIEVFSPLGGGPPLHRAGPLCWIATPERLIVYGPVGRAGLVASQILTTLSHTPLRAAGVNFTYQGRSDRGRCGPWRISGELDSVQQLTRGAAAEFSFSQVALRDDGVKLTVKVLWPTAEADALLDINYHRDGQEPIGDARAKELAQHLERAAEFERDADRIRSEVLFNE